MYYPAGSFDPQSMKSKHLPSGGMNFKWAPFYSRNKECAIIQYSVRFPKSFDFVKGKVTVYMVEMEILEEKYQTDMMDSVFVYFG